MHVMMPQVSSPAAVEAAERLEAAGHRVHACHEPHDHGFACIALRGRDCPLEAFPVDVVVDVRPTNDAHPSAAEDGAICGARRRIPLVVAGENTPNPFAPWTAAEIEGADVVPAVETASALSMAAHASIATDMLRDAIAVHGAASQSSSAEVHRVAGRLKVTLRATPPLDHETSRVAAVHVTQALRAYDPWCAGIDVRVES